MSEEKHRVERMETVPPRGDEEGQYLVALGQLFAWFGESLSNVVLEPNVHLVVPATRLRNQGGRKLQIIDVDALDSVPLHVAFAVDPIETEA